MRTRVAAALCLVALGCARVRDRADTTQLARDSVPVLVGAGDVADCRTDGAYFTAQLLDSIRGTVFVAGDVGYATKKNPNPLLTCYETTWGRHRARTRPAPGNHDYSDGGPDRYFDYFGDRAGPRSLGYYSYDLGSWHVLALNTAIAIDSGSAQDVWIRKDLDAHSGRCTVAYMHHPRFSSGPHTEQGRLVHLWKTFATYGVSVAIAGHDHIYERFAPLDTNGQPDSLHGIRQFVVGTGGADRYTFRDIVAGSEAHSGDAYGLLKLTLLPGRYQWEFIPVEHGGFRDRGEIPCHVTHAAG
ncbi:MAG: metallophosphoesterase [Gemmatimonadaceae bacterium]